jgi:hypothetical protein
VGQEPDPPDEPDFAIEDIGSDYVGDDDEDDGDNEPVDPNFLSRFRDSGGDIPI